MANQFFVQPAQFGQGLQQLAGGVERFKAGQAQEAAQEQAAARQTEAQQAMQAAFESGDPRAIQNLMVQYPEVQERAAKAFGFTNEQTEKIARAGYARAASAKDPAVAAQILDETAAQIQAAGGRPVMTSEDARALREDPEGAMQRIRSGFAMLASPQEFEAVMGPQAGANGANIGQFNPRDYTTQSFAQFVKTGDPSVLERFATQQSVDIGGVPHVFDPAIGGYRPATVAGAGGSTPVTAEGVAQSQAQIAGAREEAQLQTQRELKPQVEAAVRQAVSDVEQSAAAEGEERSNAVAMRTYETAMSNLANAMGETTTGPGMGLIPAMTSNAQIAQGAVSIMAPVLKAMFRTAGEGTFTDKDQEMLINMIPTRNDLPEARAAKIAAIDALVRAKLNQGPATEKSAEASGSAADANVVNWSDL